MITLAITVCSCAYSDNIDEAIVEDAISSSAMTKIMIPEREHGYGQLRNIVINSKAELNIYIQTIESQSGWNNKVDFLNALRSNVIDFESKNLLIYFHTEGSGSIKLMLTDPRWERENAAINITRISSGLQTDDMAYRGYAFNLKKSIPKVMFIIEKKRIVIHNNDS
jgi:hypothetical protein